VSLSSQVPSSNFTTYEYEPAVVCAGVEIDAPVLVPDNTPPVQLTDTVAGTIGKFELNVPMVTVGPAVTDIEKSDALLLSAFAVRTTPFDEVGIFPDQSDDVTPVID
jgi:hypothetical protein